MTLTELAQPTLPADALVASLASEGDATVRALARAAEFLDDRGRELPVRSPSRLAVRVLTLFELTHLIEPVKATTP